jgi:short-subunit dehydrogenase
VTAPAATPAKTALVTGASSGIGAATARALAADGYAVALVARRRDRLDALAAELERGGRPALSCPADVTDAAAVRALVERVVQTWGRVDVLVNNAGRGMAATVEATTEADLRALLELNLVAVLTMTRAVLPGMLARRAGHIVNVGSVAGRRGMPLRSAYAATKFALTGFTESLRQEVRRRGVHVTLVQPIYTATEFDAVEIRRAEPLRTRPVQSPETVARAVVRALRRPRAEIYPFPPARILGVLSVLSPRFVDWLIRRRWRDQL